MATEISSGVKRIAVTVDGQGLVSTVITEDAYVESTHTDTAYIQTTITTREE